MIDTVIRDTRYALRIILKHWASSLASIVALAVGIGSVTLVFTIVNAMVFRGLPVDAPDRIIRLTNGRNVVTTVSYRDVQDWRGLNTLTGMAAYRSMPMTLQDENRPTEVFSGSYIEDNAFWLLGQKPLLGRDFLAEDSRTGAPPAVILSASVWKSRYNADPQIVGRIVRVNNVPSTVIGVMPSGFEFPLIDKVWQPLTLAPGLDTQKRNARVLRAFARLKDGVTLTQAQAELQAVATRLAHDYPDTNGKLEIGLSPYTGGGTQPMYIWLFVAAAFVLLTACASVATLLLVRAAYRVREVAMRMALGARRWDVIRALLVENTIVATVAGLFGLLLAVIGIRLFAAAVADINFPYWYKDAWTMDRRVFAFLAMVCLGTGLAFGAAPVLYVSKTNLNEILKEGGRSAAGGANLNRWNDILSVVQLALTLILLAGASLMIRSYVAIYRADLIIDTSRQVATTLRLTGPKYTAPAQRTEFVERLSERLGGFSAIASAAAMNAVPFAGGPNRQLAIEGQSIDRAALPMVSYVTITDRYFETLGLSLLQGRVFTPLDGTPGHEHAIVNQQFVTMFLPNVNPIGHRIQVTDPNTRTASTWLTIIGVAPTVRQEYLHELDPVVYVPHRTDPPPMAWLLVRARSDLAAVSPLLRSALRELDPDLGLGQVMPMSDLASQSRWAHRVFGSMFALFAVAALLVSSVGLFAVTAHTVVQRTQEIGVRMAIGAQRWQVVRMFARGVLFKLVVGLIIGLVGAFTLGRLLQSLLVQTSSADPTSIIASGLLLALVGAAACCLPAWRATRLDPVVTLRHE